MGRLQRFRATVSFDQIRAGGIYDLDLVEDPEWSAYIANGWFVEAPEFGEPDQPVEVSVSGQDPRPPGPDPAPPDVPPAADPVRATRTRKKTSV